MNVCVQVLYEHILSFLLGKGSGVKLFGHMVNICLVIYKKLPLSSTVIVTFKILTSDVYVNHYC